MICPLCQSNSCRSLAHAHRRSYFSCSQCGLCFLSPEYLPGREQERARYETHNNSMEDSGYFNFFSPFVKALVPLLKNGAQGLDYGCGPGPLLAKRLQRLGFPVKIYDPFFFPDRSALEQHYDFVTCTEAAEHFHKPREEFSRLYSLLKPNGILGMMTNLLPEATEFSSWWYIRDETHTTFYSEASIRWISEHCGLEILRLEDALMFFRKSP